MTISSIALFLVTLFTAFLNHRSHYNLLVFNVDFDETPQDHESGYLLSLLKSFKDVFQT